MKSSCKDGARIKLLEKFSLDLVNVEAKSCLPSWIEYRVLG